MALYRGGRDSSPPWHCKLRAKRSAARRVLGSIRGKYCRARKAPAVARALHCLLTHHTRPAYRIPLIAAFAYKRIFGTYPVTWSNWDRSWSKTGRPTKSPAKAKKDKKEKDGVPKFPAYDAGNGASSSSPSATSALESPEVIQLLRTLAAKDQSIAPQVESLLPDPLKEDLRLKQREINTIRKLQQKVERKEQAISKRESQMTQFLEDIKQHVMQEKARHRADVDQLKKELEEARSALADAKNGKTPVEMEQDENLESLLCMDSDAAKENQELKQRLALMEKEKRQQCEHMYNMQLKMDAFIKQYADHTHNGGPVAPKQELEPAQSIRNGTPHSGPPIDLTEDTPATLPAVASPDRPKAAGLQPFRCGKDQKQRSSPYGTHYGRQQQMETMDS